MIHIKQDRNKQKKNLLQKLRFLCCSSKSPTNENEVSIDHQSVISIPMLPSPLPNIMKYMDKSYTDVECLNYKPIGKDQRIFKYNCPICFRYFKKMLKSQCCGNYLCHFCNDDIQKYSKLQEREHKCSFCQILNPIYTDVQNTDKLRQYLDSSIVLEQNKENIDEFDETQKCIQKVLYRKINTKKQLLEKKNTKQQNQSRIY